MLRLSLESLRARPARFVATLLAIVLATGFLAGALILQNSLGAALSLNATSQLEGIDAVVTGTGGFEGDSGAFGELDSGGVDLDVLDAVLAVPGVADAAGVVEGSVDLLGDGEVLQEGLTGRAWVGVDELNGFELVEGSAPTGPTDAVVDRRTVDALALELGDALELATPQGARSFVLTGISTFGDRPASGGQGDLSLAPETALDVLSFDAQRWDEVRVVAAGGTSPDDLVATLGATLPGEVVVESGDAVREAEAGLAGGIASAIGVGLQAFAYLALIVGALIIYNTFAAIVGQRTREFALLRAVGASPRQVRRAIRLEAVGIGLVASALGLGVGVLLYLLLAGSVPAYRDFVGTGRDTLVVTRWSVLQVMVTGVVVAVGSALLPAFRAGRTRPVEAMTRSAVDEAGTSRVRTVFGVGLLGGGVAALLAGTGGAPAWVAAVGAAALFLGAVVGGPVVANLVGKLLVRVTGRADTTSRLAVANAARNPTRTAATANALVVGVALVVFTTAAGQSIRDWAADQVAALSGADLQVVETLPDGLSPELLTSVADVEGVARTVTNFGQVGFLDDGAPVSAADLDALVDVMGATPEQGSFDGLGSGDAIVVNFYAQQDGTEVGDILTVAVNGREGSTVDLEVAAIVPFSIDYPGPVMASVDAFVGDAEPAGGLRASNVLLSVDEDVDRVLRRVENVTFGFSGVAVVQGNQLATIVRSVFDVIITGINALLGVAVVIALFGIVNTLVLAIIERTREIGVLRAVGMTREQLRATVRGEAVIVSLLGTVIGVTYGLFGAWAVTRPLFREVGGSMTWPFAEIAAILVLGLVIGVVSSLVPAWRAARLDVLDAIRTA